MNFRGLHSWRYARPRAIPFAIFRRVNQVRLGDGWPVFPETVMTYQTITYSIGDHRAKGFLGKSPRVSLLINYHCEANAVIYLLWIIF